MDKRIVEEILCTRLRKVKRPNSKLRETFFLYNEDETVSIERFEDGTYYVLEFVNGDWKISGYYEEK